MFVPKVPFSSAASLRNPRRRQRTSSDESVKQHQAKRQRSNLHDKSRDDDTADDNVISNEEQGISAGLELMANGEFDNDHAINSGIHKQLVLRGAKINDSTGSEADGIIILSRTEHYVVSQLPTLPDQLRGGQDYLSRCVFTPTSEYALVLTQTHAIIWPYSTSSSASAHYEAFTIPIPESCIDPIGQAPLGVLLSSGGSGLPGMMIITPSTGKIVYWETISSVSLSGLSKQRQTGIQGNISGMLSDESAIKVICAEPSGIIVTFSSGRVAHITVRNAQGQPSLMTAFLQTPAGTGNSGLFGSIKHVLGGSGWRKDTVATKTGISHQRGQRDVITATKDGWFEIWDTHWNNGNSLKKKVSIKQDVCRFLGAESVGVAGGEDFRVLDFACVSRKKRDIQASSPDAEEPWSFYILIYLSQSSNCTGLTVVHVSMTGDRPSVISSYAVDIRGLSMTESNVSDAKIFVPRPDDTAFIVLGQSVVLLSLVPGQLSRDLQQPNHSRRWPLPFQDKIHFRGHQYKLLGAGSRVMVNERSIPTCLVMVQGFGVVRIDAVPRINAETKIESVHITAKSKLEQAIFYGARTTNPLDLASKEGLDFSVEELEQAAMEICSELLHSRSSFLSTTGLSIEQNLRLRVKALEDLASLLTRHAMNLSRQCRWELLWGAEKLAAQRAMWKVNEQALVNRDGKPTFLSGIIHSMTEKIQVETTNKNSDNLRRWFLHDTEDIHDVIPWTFSTLMAQKGKTWKSGARTTENIFEASELLLSLLETAFRYRDEHVDLFGLHGEALENGVLLNGYVGLPEFWTSQSTGYIETGNLLNLELDVSRAWTQQTPSKVDENEAQLMRKIGQNTARHIRVLGQIHSERSRWLSAQDDPKYSDEGMAAEEAHVKQRRWHLFKLAGIGHLDDAIRLAEESRDMTGLVELVIELQDQTQHHHLEKGSTRKRQSPWKESSDEFGRKISLYFSKFGEPWADAFFTRQISMKQSGSLFSMNSFQPFITNFLRKRPDLSRIVWINDVVGENDYESATRNLEKLAIGQESDIWSHRVELSLAKLNGLAALEQEKGVQHSTLRECINRVDKLSGVGTIHKMVHDYISSSLQGAIDDKAEVDLAIEHFGNKDLLDRPSLREILNDLLTAIVSRQVIGPDQLVHLLTLLGPPRPSGADGDISEQAFYLALRVIQLNSYYAEQEDASYFLALQRLVWRRCMIRDNWEGISRQLDAPTIGGVSILNTSFFHTLQLCHKSETGKDMKLTSALSPLPPSAILEFSDSDFIASRYQTERQARIIKDLDTERQILQKYVKEADLETRFNEMMAFVKSSGMYFRSITAFIFVQWECQILTK
ncbi:hypothetical protein ASPZODRAFT_58185 [Penicilliopsis zonata CBS 506.65]|uniref:Nucleoporin Nup133/Nup155-like N-terminal domain-containing protein n=1 Tax=Penicilliopsis zonata CBS 506.65 TaxID=1073090 RepID=A0A1L9SQI9_9EURO|nr:hypothetical protein ASPZODRAFT_58185 [Penicilliopsis zonata CBS 506.65]OJJ49499.1 hypothetical protein ASPZODRAFT_58185 [Penicilliopsis zonata CBS 506.65]